MILTLLHVHSILFTAPVRVSVIPLGTLVLAESTKGLHMPRLFDTQHMLRGGQLEELCSHA